MAAKYLFGDSDAAAHRLELLARVFRESTRAFIAEASNAHVGLAVDLGCGRGFTTHLIAEALGCDRVVGLDTSPHLIELARRTAAAHVTFALHDVCSIPFPCAPADLIFCRYLLTHLEQPAMIVARWAMQLRAGGTMLIEEVETIRTAHPVFAAYLKIVEATLSSQHNCLYAGPLAAALGSPGGLSCVRSDLRLLPVRNSDAARMFQLNLQAWKDSEFVRANYDADTIRGLEDGLKSLADDRSDASAISWTIRQVRFTANS